jgi:putative DNA primase/helicase
MRRNLSDVSGQLLSAGLLVDSKIGLQIDTLKPIRCKVINEAGQKRGWYHLHSMSIAGGDELIVGSYGIWRGDDPGTMKVALTKEDLPRITPEQAQAIKARAVATRKEAEAELLRRQNLAATRAAGWWRECVDHGTNEYLNRKGLPAGNLYGARLSPSQNLVIPVQDVTGKTWGLQVIYHDAKVRQRKGRDKDFCPPGMAKTGHMYIIGSLWPGCVALLCEGFATGATLHQATGLPVIVSFDAGNLMPVAVAVAKRYRGIRILVCADDDYLQICRECKAWTTIHEPECTACGQPHGKRNAGQESAQATALAIGGAVAIPVFPGLRLKTHKGPTDWNDLHTHPDGGISSVARQIEASLSAAGWRGMTAVTRPGMDEQGGGDGKRQPMRGLYSLDEACERWTLLYGADGAFFDSVEHMIIRKADVMALIPDHASRDWKLRPDRQVARFSEVGFDPTEKDPRVVCNLWGGWPTTPKAGDCEPLLELLRYLCSLESNAGSAYEWALKWLAYPIQHQGAKMKSTLVFHGMQGAGKNLFFDAIASLYGEYGGTVDQLAVESQFNDWASRKLFLVFDEVVARNELYFLKNRIKSLITGDVIRINPKNLSAWDERNHCNGVWLSNELHPCAVELFDRRHFIIWTPPALSASIYTEIAACLANGGREALHDYLLHLPLGDFDEHSKPPMTDAKLRVQELSAGSIEMFFRDWIAGDLPYPVCPCAGGQLYRAYSRYAAQVGERVLAQKKLSGYLATQIGWEQGMKDVFETAHYQGGKTRKRMVLPPEELLHVGNADYRKRPDQLESQWTTDGYYAFQTALGGDDK